MDIEDRLQFVAFHESVHSLYAVHAGFKVNHVSIYPQGETLVVWPFEWRDTFWYYKDRPIKTLRQVVGMAATISAPARVLDEPVEGGDLNLLATLRQHWQTARGFTSPPGPVWIDLYQKVKMEICKWDETPGRNRQIGAVAQALLEHNELNGKDFTTLAQRYAPGAQRSGYAA